MAVKKTTQKEGSSWVGKVEEYSRKIWLAGLGVYSKIDSDGSKLFETLVKDGEKAEKVANSAVGKKVTAAKATAGSRISDAKKQVLGTWSELEGALDTRLNKAISRLGVPSRTEVKALHTKVAEDELPKLLDPYFRTREAQKTASGTGLGLGITRDIVTSHNGTLSIQSELGVGTTVTVTLPRRAEFDLRTEVPA